MVIINKNTPVNNITKVNHFEKLVVRNNEFLEQ